MPKYGRGLNREIVSAINNSILNEPLTVSDVRKLIKIKNWKPEPTEKYIVVTLANGANSSHSLTYKKYFVSLGNGSYKLRDEYKGNNWK